MALDAGNDVFPLNALLQGLPSPGPSQEGRRGGRRPGAPRGLCTPILEV